MSRNFRQKRTTHRGGGTDQQRMISMRKGRIEAQSPERQKKTQPERGSLDVAEGEKTGSTQNRKL